MPPIVATMIIIAMIAMTAIMTAKQGQQVPLLPNRMAIVAMEGGIQSPPRIVALIATAMTMIVPMVTIRG